MNSLKIDSGVRPSAGALRLRSDVEVRTTKETRIGRIVLTVLLAAVLVIAPSMSFAGENTAAETSKESGLGAAAAVSSLFYGPAKILYATGGLIVGSMAWAFTAGDSAVAEKVFTRSLRGDYVITPGMLLGDESLEFIGRDGTEPTTAAPAAVASAPPVYPESEYDDLGW